MQKLIVTVSIAAVTLFTACNPTEKETVVELNTTPQKVSYGLGMDVGKNIAESAFDSIDVDLFIAGAKAVLSEKETKLSEDEAQTIIRDYLVGLQQQKTAAAVSKGQAFLAENAQKEGVKTTDSGLQYEIITAGNGPKPKLSDKVKAHYAGTLLDGSEFDSSYKRGQPSEFPVSGVIAGWTEALQMMSVGSKWKLYIPSNLAYGERGAGQMIGPNETLIFEVELVEIVK